ncbi:uncharacterized protein LOC134537196 [Bacillus rossius redtenbacheri]|uniref:uncharacterized protein LOC134537196 n=1 Tax=Bacillus rossius redtenbacheri TaxID=93214 RepID=UPI002FDF05F0
MDFDDDEAEQIFLLEVIVNSISLSDRGNYNAKSPLTVGVKFIGHPLMDIRQDEFSDALTTVKHDVFTCGKSYLFPILPRKLLAGIEKSPLILTVYHTLPDTLGQTDIDLSECMGEMIRGVIKSPEEVPVARYLKGVHLLVDANNKNTGTISLFVRLSCLGQSILSPVQILEEQKAYLFKNTMIDLSRTTEQFSGATSGDTKRPQPLTFGSRSRLVKQLDEDVMTARLPIMYSLSEAHSLCNAGTDTKSKETNTGCHEQFTLKNIFYELNKIGNTEQSPLQDSTCQATTKDTCEEPGYDEGGMMYKLSYFQNYQDVDVKVTRGEAPNDRPLFYCTPNEEFPNQQKDLMQECNGCSSGSRQAPFPAQHPDGPTQTQHTATTCSCNQGNAWRKSPQIQSEMFSRTPAVHSCACDDRNRRPLPAPTITQQKQVTASEVQTPRTVCRCNQEGAGGASRKSPQVVCFPSTRTRTTQGSGENSVEATVPAARHRCTCIYSKLGEQEAGAAEDQEISLSYTPPHPPVRHDTTSCLSPAGRGEPPVEARPHPPVRYDTTGVLSAAHNHPPVRYDTTGVLSPAAGLYGDQTVEDQEEEEEEEEEKPPAVSTTCTCCCCCCCRCTSCVCRVKVTTLVEPPRIALSKSRRYFPAFKPDPSKPPRPHSCPFSAPTPVPPHMGWLWTHSDLPLQAGWRPGYISLAAQRRMREAALGRTTDPRAPGGRRQRRAKKARSRTRKPVTDATVHVVQRDGRFYVTLVDQDQTGEPMRFRAPGCGDAGDAASEHSWPRSDRSSDIKLEVMSPADLAPPPEPAAPSRNAGVQLEEGDLPPPPEVDVKPLRPRKKGKK